MDCGGSKCVLYIMLVLMLTSVDHSLDQWFSTGVPREILLNIENSGCQVRECAVKMCDV